MMNARPIAQTKSPVAVPQKPVEVWLVEDNRAFCNAVVRFFKESDDIRCTGSFSACEDVIAKLKNGAKVDVLLLDVQLAGMNGIEGLPKIKAICPNLCVIMLTVFEDDEKIFDAICAGASGYLLKSSPLETIVESVHQAIVATEGGFSGDGSRATGSGVDGGGAEQETDCREAGAEFSYGGFFLAQRLCEVACPLPGGRRGEGHQGKDL